MSEIRFHNFETGLPMSSQTHQTDSFCPPGSALCPEGLPHVEVFPDARRKPSCRKKGSLTKTGHKTTCKKETILQVSRMHSKRRTYFYMQEGKHLAGNEDARQKKSFKTAGNAHKRTASVLPNTQKSRSEPGSFSFAIQSRILQC